MSIGRAKKFIQHGMQDSVLRGQVNAASNMTELLAILGKEDFLFSASDFDEAYHNLLTQCQVKEQADQLREFKMWWDMTLALMQRQEG